MWYTIRELMLSNLKRILFGAPLPTHRIEHERLNVPAGLAIFAADALSSTAYATEEILLALVASAYAVHSGLISVWVAVAIVLLIAVVVTSYRQVIKEYPTGGGAYTIAKENLGKTSSHIAAAALLVDYILTVAVSVSAGVAAFVSTGLVSSAFKTELCLFFTIIIIFVNLRGLKESGRAFAVPAYLFIVLMLTMIGVGIWKLVMMPTGIILPTPQATGTAGSGFGTVAFILVFLKAFSHGCAGLTGIEAVSNGVKSFAEPSSHRANITMTIMGTLLSTIFLGVTYLAFTFNIMPLADETVVSQVARIVFGDHTFLYYLVQFSTMVLLILAANTAFAGFPNVTNLLAHDGYMPRQLMNIGDRLVFNNSIIGLGVLSMLLIFLYSGDTHSLVPLYAVGVFICFTVSQLGMVKHHLKHRRPGWQFGLGINSFGAAVTAAVTVVIAVEKFTEGAWIVFIAIPLIIVMFHSIKRHYLSVAKQLMVVGSGKYSASKLTHTVLVLVSSLNKVTFPALEYAESLSTHVEAIHVSLDPKATEKLKSAWNDWECGVRLTILESPYRSINRPVFDYIDEVNSRPNHGMITIIIPEFVTKKWWHNLLHNQSAIMIKALLRFRRGTVVTTVRYYLEE